MKGTHRGNMEMASAPRQTFMAIVSTFNMEPEITICNSQSRDTTEIAQHRTPRVN